MGLLAAWVWPKVDLRRYAQNAIQEAFWASVFIAALTACMSAIGFMHEPETEVLIDGLFISAVFAGFAFGIYRRSRFAALAAFIVYSSGTLYVWFTSGPKGFLVRGLLALAFLHGLRGTIAYHKLPPRPANLPSLAESFSAVRQSPAKDLHNSESKSSSESLP